MRRDGVPRTLKELHAAHRVKAKPPKPESTPMDSASAGQLRGIPAIGRSVTGAIRGSIPHQDGLHD